MRDLIVRALCWVLSVLAPWTHRTAPGRHAAAYLATLPTATPAPMSPWANPWTGPSAEEVRAIFRAEETLRLTPVRRERFFATAFAECGIEYPYRYPGDQFTALGVQA